MWRAPAKSHWLWETLVYTYTHVHARTHAHPHTHTYIQIYADLYTARTCEKPLTLRDPCIHIHTRTHARARAHTHTHTPTHIYKSTQIYIRRAPAKSRWLWETLVYTYTHARTHDTHPYIYTNLISRSIYGAHLRKAVDFETLGKHPRERNRIFECCIRLVSSCGVHVYSGKRKRKKNENAWLEKDNALYAHVANLHVRHHISTF